jgi:hypothetical protein
MGDNRGMAERELVKSDRLVPRVQEMMRSPSRAQARAERVLSLEAYRLRRQLLRQDVERFLRA